MIFAMLKRDHKHAIESAVAIFSKLTATCSEFAQVWVGFTLHTCDIYIGRYASLLFHRYLVNTLLSRMILKLVPLCVDLANFCWVSFVIEINTPCSGFLFDSCKYNAVSLHCYHCCKLKVIYTTGQYWNFLLAFISSISGISMLQWNSL